MLQLSFLFVDPYSALPREGITEWEAASEQDEFQRAAALYRPLSGAMASRFTHAKYDDDADNKDLPAANEVSQN